MKIFGYLDECNSACFGLTCKNLWSIHSEKHPNTRLLCYTIVSDESVLWGWKRVCLVHLMEEWFRFRGLLGPRLWRTHLAALWVEKVEAEIVLARGNLGQIVRETEA